LLSCIDLLSKAVLARLDELGPELVVEVVSPGSENARRDREAKLALYSRRDAIEYWIVDPIARTVYQYHRPQGGPLQLRGVLGSDDWLTSDLLEGFAVGMSELWP
jgi:Uma2 family endonuclease